MCSKISRGHYQLPKVIDKLAQTEIKLEHLSRLI